MSASMNMRGSWRLVGMISSMIVWAAWFVVVYGLTGVGCDAGWQRQTVPGGNLLSLLMLLSSVLALLLIGWCAWRGFRHWQSGNEAGAEGGEHRQRQRFTGLVMLVLSLFAGIGTIMVSVPILMLDPCSR